MTTREEIRAFLADPTTFAAGAADAATWAVGLPLVDDLIRRAGDNPLRPAQRRAFEEMAPLRAGLILGPPGTGKTHALAWMAIGYLLARRQAGQPCRILVSAFTRNAIGNLLEAIAERSTHLGLGFDVRFLGRPPANGLAAGVTAVEPGDAADLFAAEACVVGCTVWGLNRALVGLGGPTGEVFHLVCIDEASQLVLSHGLMALSGLAPGGRVLVAGDDRQLPPIRVEHDHDIDHRRLGSSFYAFLQSAGVREFPLDETFRLNGPLTSFPSARFYGGDYVSAVPERRLELLPNWQDGLESWERVALDPENPVCVLLHDGPRSGTVNAYEAHLAAKLARALRRRQPPAGVNGTPAEYWEHRLAVVSPHRAQNSLIRATLSAHPDGDGCIVETVDRIQGRERDAIVASYTVSDPEFALAEAAFIFSRERLNVTVTRARSKLIVIVSHQLLKVVPGEQDVLDDAEALREFVFGAREVDTIPIPGPNGEAYPVQLRVRTFDEAAVLPDIRPTERPAGPDLPPIDADLERLMAVIERLAVENPRYGDVPDFRIGRETARRAEDLFPSLRLLQRHGRVTLKHVHGRSEFWSVKPLARPQVLFSLDPGRLLERLEEAVMGARPTGKGAAYERVRDRFDWLDPNGNDLLWPLVSQLGQEGKIAVTVEGDERRLSFARPAAEAEGPAEPPAEMLLPEDFLVLNRLEDLEARRINFGIVEDWHSIPLLAESTGMARAAVADCIRRLELHGYVMRAEGDRLRSRMAELARVVRYVKQRFVKTDADSRPFLVRSLKLEVRERDKPTRTRSLNRAIRALSRAMGSNASARQALSGLEAMLQRTWGVDDPLLAGFQVRGLRKLFRAWVEERDAAFVVAADTGSGKTEAAGLPLIAGALYDQLRGIVGTRAVLVYPRIRLAANQAQRLTRYLAALGRVEGMPTLTIGLQNGSVPQHWGNAKPEDWAPAGAGDAFQFPFFNCPEPDCGQALLVRPGAGEGGADELCCTTCDWRFGGWIGTKEGLSRTPPTLFMPTTESVHQWLHDPRYGVLFGDGATPPRALLADEIHLYTHIQGAQIGYALRRLLARIKLNGSPVLAVGMSATLGRPAAVWGSLVGMPTVEEIIPRSPERRPNPKGREYFYFVQPEIESRGRDVAGASTTIQSLMALAHGMRRRTGSEGGFRGIVFLDSIDKLKRLHASYKDAEEGLRLASLRTRFFPDDPATGEPRRTCCGEPAGCDLFRNGECWHFAATDERQWGARGRYRPGDALAVSWKPVSSQSESRVEPMIQASDIVFATSSLEVGYDDPDMALVYQHYAPLNIASFVQRKGRGGRGSDDRPVTGVTLSLYSPRDSWFFGRPTELLDARRFEVPLNMDNVFVRRAQASALVLDAVARQEATGRVPFDVAGRLNEEARAAIMQMAEAVFGAGFFERLGFGSLDGFWRALWTKATGLKPGEAAWDRRSRIDWVPRTLFATINLPEVAVIFDQGGKAQEKEEDIALALAAAAPGNMVRRWGNFEVHWRVPQAGRHPYLRPEEVRMAERFRVGSEQELLAALPVDAREDLGGQAPVAEILRPRRIRLEVGARVLDGTTISMACWDGRVNRVAPMGNGAPVGPEIDHRSTGSLRGFPILTARSEGRDHPAGSIGRMFSRVQAFCGDAAGATTGLQLAKVYWGADADLRLVKDTTSLGISQTFTGAGGRSQLIGYSVETEGVRFHLDRARLDAFQAAETARLRDAQPDLRWHRIQMTRYIVQRRARGAGISGYEAHRIAELVVAASGHPDLRDRLARLLRMWDPDQAMELLRRTYDEVLSQHPLLTPRRIEKLGDTLRSPGFFDVLSGALQVARDDTALPRYVRSLVLHGVAMRLKQAFVLFGRGEEARVVVHAKLPIQFGADADDVITVAENGHGGDGTARKFLECFEEAARWLLDGGLTECPNAAEDRLLDAAARRRDQHQTWRVLDPRDPRTLERLALDLGMPIDRGHPSPQQLLRLLYGAETVSGRPFALFDLWQEVKELEQELSARLGREPEAWEVTSAAVVQARDGRRVVLGQLLEAYAALEDAADEDSLSPASRLADQVYRISGRLCVDGCPACLHGDSDLMPHSLVMASVSRRVLERFAATF